MGRTFGARIEPGNALVPWSRLVGRQGQSALALMLIALAGCGSSDTDRAKKAIDVGLVTHPSCQRVPVDIEVGDKRATTADLVALLRTSGLVKDGVVKDWRSLSTSTQDVAGLVFTDKGRTLVVEPAEVRVIPKQPCLRTGHFEVTKVYAVDFGTDMEGKSVANARASIRFVPEDWMAATRNQPKMADFWNSIDSMEHAGWMYRLVKSGDEFFYTGPGQKLP